MNESEFATLALAARSEVEQTQAPTTAILEAARRSSRRRRAVTLAGLAAAAAVFAVLASITLPPGQRAPDTATPDPTTPLSGAWRLVSGMVDGRELVLQPGYPVTFVVERRDGVLTASGQAACNSYGTDITLTGRGVEIGQAQQTLMGCIEPVQSLETTYLAALATVTDYRQSSSGLVLSGPAAELRFTPLSAIPTAELVDTDWQLETIVDGDVASSVVGSATLLLRSDGTFAMSSGCGLVLTGRWSESNGAIIFTESSESGGCQQHPQSQAILAVSDFFYVDIDGDAMTVTGRHGGELVYRRAPATDQASS